MATPPDGVVRVEGLSELRKALRDTDRQVNNEFGKDLREAAAVVAQVSSALAPKRSGTLARSYKGGGAGLRAYVRTRVPYAGVIEYGGTVGRGHSAGRPGATRISARAPVQHALERTEDAVVEKVARGVDRATRKAGWH